MRHPAVCVSALARSLAVAATLAGLVAVAHSGRAQEPRPRTDHRPTTVSFELLPSNHMVLTASINGKEPGRYIFDVGSPVTLLSNEAAEAAGVIEAKAPRSFLFGTRGDASVKTFQVGELKAGDLPVIVMDHPALGALGKLLGKPIDGLVGYTFFARYKTTIDYQAKTITFQPVENEVRDLMKTLQAQLTGPKTARTRVLAPSGLWGLTVGEPKPEGVPITTVRDGSPAAEAGLKPGDLMTSLDGRWTTSVADVYAATAGVEPGKEAEVVLLRDGALRTLKVTPRIGF